MTRRLMTGRLKSKTGFGFLVAAVAIGGAWASAGCDQWEDVAKDILKGRDGGAPSSDANRPPPGSACGSDSDCRTFSDYRTGCDCRALGVKDMDPVSNGPGVQCLIDPCQNKAATCQAGSCVIGPKAKACLATAECPAGSFCTTETGSCDRPPGCGPNDVCPTVCAGTCQPRPTTGAACGPKTCAAGMVCCNASCGICTTPTGVCTQQACN